MKTVAITIALNAKEHIINQTAPYIFDEWIIVEGASESLFCTKWCKEMPSEYHINGHSVDGTAEAIRELQNDRGIMSKIIHIEPKGLWKGKVAMFNAALDIINEPCYLWQVDADEVWKESSVVGTNQMVDHLGYDGASFMCNYHLPEGMIVRGTWGESTVDGYHRMWKYRPGSKFISHEPPRIEGATKIMHHKFTPRFDHYSYFYESDVIFKSKWYSMHENIYEGWKEIVEGKVQLPCGIDRLFKNPNLPQHWRQDSFITYA